jgi:hypothetical protein
MPEQTIVVAHREHLWWLLAEAAQLEHMIMCQYLFAEATLKDGEADGLTPDQADAVQRWRKTLHGIAVEEMLHLALVANLMCSIGAAPLLGRPNFPQRSGYFPAGLQLDLLPFGEQALRHFLYLERPEGMERQDAAEITPSAPPRVAVDAGELEPRGQEFATVGHLYRGIAGGLRGLSDRSGERALFVGSPRAQATPELLHWPQLIAVRDLQSALAAVEEIIEQGEGARGEWQDAHYGRFLGIWEEFGRLRRADPSFEPARPVLAAFTRQPFDVPAPQRLITDARTHHVAELAAVAYEMVLQLLLRLFTHTQETDEQLGVLVNSAIDLMAGALRPLASAMTRMPIGDAFPGNTTGFAFEMFYTMTNLVPWREPAWALLHERVALLADRCQDVVLQVGDEGADGVDAAVRDVVGQVHERAGAVAAALATHVPQELLAVPSAGPGR